MENKIQIFTGTYTEPILFGTGEILEGKSEGIYRYEFDPDTRSLSRMDLTPAVNPSYLTLSSDCKYLYAVSELKEFQGKTGGAVSAYAIDPATKKLTFLNQQPTVGTDPCHVTVTKDNTYLFVSNYSSGSLCVYPIQKDGSLQEAAEFIQHTGKSVNQDRQLGPHTHSVTLAMDERFAFAIDLGLDKILTYEIDHSSGKLALRRTFCAEPGAGPRHCAFHPNNKFCYIANELDCTMYALGFHAEEGSFEKLQSVPLVTDPSFKGENSGADIHVTPDGCFVYASNRGHDSLVCYKIHPESGLLSYVGAYSCHGNIPRSFAIDPSGRFLIVCNQNTDNMVIFSIHSDGTLSFEAEAYAPTPVCVRPCLMD